MLINLKLLKKDMQTNGWVISSFAFRYKRIRYIVLVHLFGDKLRKKNTYALVCLSFLLENDLNNSLIVEANTAGLLMDAKTLREFFGIEYHENLGDILSQFSNYLNHFIPVKVPVVYPRDQKEAMLSSLSKSDAEDPNKRYCFAVKRNPIGSKRSAFNSDKAHLLRPSLFDKYKDDVSISFCFSSDEHDEKSDFAIMNSFSQNH
ncbi:DUF6037 family protein [Limosilactobacillus reuteri]|uniref:DUF6037 family protein n=1 Tax=Limosilactobacillus reuteri TaxID=1598 RepID=UPI002551CF0C|nr:DUF6037 family protein [Limosilactobacillus reuteri]MDL2057037.1 DUF6037 family protein [Limosilactobacillus reuteri]